MLRSLTLRGAVAVGVVTTLGLVPSALAAGGAVTLGPTNPARPGEVAQQINYTTPPIFVNTVVPSGQSVTAPADGVITGWTFYTREITTVGATVRLRVLTRNGALDGNGGGSFTITNSGPNQSVPPVEGNPNSGVKHAFTNQHIPIKAGQYPGYSLLRNTTGFFVVRLPVGTGYKFAQAQVDGGYADGSTSTLSGVTDQFVSFAAQFERDADRDRFGDTTQDRCTAFAGIYNGCVTKMSADKSTVKRGKKVRVTIVGAKVGRAYSIRLGSRKVLVSGKVPRSGKVVRYVTIPKATKAKDHSLVFTTSKLKEKAKIRITVRK